MCVCVCLRVCVCQDPGSDGLLQVSCVWVLQSLSRCHVCLPANCPASDHVDTLQPGAVGEAGVEARAEGKAGVEARAEGKAGVEAGAWGKPEAVEAREEAGAGLEAENYA